MIKNLGITILTVIWLLVGLFGLYHLVIHNQIDQNFILAIFGIGFTINTYLIKLSNDSINAKLEDINQRFESIINRLEDYPTLKYEK